MWKKEEMNEPYGMWKKRDEWAIWYEEGEQFTWHD
jgi:hypothetical protein